MKTAMSMIWSAVGVAVALCLALALLGSCSQAPAQPGGQSDGAPGSASAEEVMSGYPEGTKTEVSGRATSLNTSIVTLELM